MKDMKEDAVKPMDIEEIKKMDSSTILERFKKIILKEHTKEDVRDFFFMESVYLAYLSLNYDSVDKFPIQLQQNYLEFYDYFIKKYDEETCKQILSRNFGFEAYVIRTCQEIDDLKIDKEVKEYLSNIDSFITREAEELINKILNIKYFIDLIALFPNNTITLGVNGVLRKEEKNIEKEKRNILYIIAHMISGNGVLIVKYKTDEKTYHVFAVESFYGMIWMPVAKEKLENYQCPYLEDDQCNFVYEEITKDKHYIDFSLLKNTKSLN